MKGTVRVVMALALVVGGCSKEPAKSRPPNGPRPGASEDSPPSPESTAPAPAQPTLGDRLAEAATLSDALAITVPQMEDTTNDTSVGALGLSMWSASHLRFADVAVRRNETSAKLILKDSDRERGKRMCARGVIVQIEKVDTGGASIFDGLMMKYDGTVISFLAAGDTGDLVENSRARFCGISTGRYTYSNSGGGTTHAIQLVGMFDLPANRRASP